MTGAVAIALFDGAITLFDFVVQEINSAVARGEISAEAQVALKARVTALRAGAAFEGPEWEIKGTPLAVPTEPPQAPSPTNG